MNSIPSYSNSNGGRSSAPSSRRPSSSRLSTNALPPLPADISVRRTGSSSNRSSQNPSPSINLPALPSDNQSKLSQSKELSSTVASTITTQISYYAQREDRLEPEQVSNVPSHPPSPPPSMAPTSIPWDSLLPIMDLLSRWNMDHYIDFILHTIYGPESATVRAERGIKSWTCYNLGQWLQQQIFLGNDEERIALQSFIIEQGIDGDTFTFLLQGGDREHPLLVNQSCLSYTNRLVLNLILYKWNSGCDDINLTNDIFQGVPLGVRAGYVDDLSKLDIRTACTILTTNNNCMTTGQGCVYGQLMLIGYNEFRQIDKKWIPFGLSNQKYILSRHKNANGFTEVRRFLANCNDQLDKNIYLPKENRSSFIELRYGNMEVTSPVSRSMNPNELRDLDEIVIEYGNDPTKDIFQLGRAVHSTNDIVLPGYIHLADDGNYTGPLSRWACRIECERVPPFRSFIYAGGFNDQRILRVRGIDENNMHDGFTSFGVRIFHPHNREWVEVSVLGNIYEPRPIVSDTPVYPTKLKRTNYGNMLIDGTIIDLCGVLLMFQDPLTMVHTREVNPQDVINRLNARNPQCPVLLTEIKFCYIDPYERVRKAHERAEQSIDNRMSGLRCGPIHVPLVDYGSNIEEEQRSYVFPACGHVHGYHKSLDGRSCPLCRKHGPFVPIAFAFEASICDQRPTHVFNPCGHVASHRTCRYWSNLKLVSKSHHPQYNSPSGPPARPFSPDCRGLIAICPFCATHLDSTVPYSKLILQYENGVSWESDTVNVTSSAVNSASSEKSTSSGLDDEEDEEVQNEWKSIRNYEWESEQFFSALVTSQQQLFQRERVRTQTKGQHYRNYRQSMKELTFPCYAPQVIR